MTRVLLPLLLLISATAFAACGGDDSDDDGTAAALPSTQAAQDAGSPSAVVEEDGDDEPQPLPAGVYTSTTFAPKTSATLSEGWALAVDSGSELVFEHQSAFENEQAFIGLFRVTRVWSQANFSTPEPSPDDLIQWMIDHRDLDITDGPKQVTIGGFTGRQIDVSVDTNFDVPLFDAFEAHFRDRFRIIQLEVDGERVIVASGPFVAGAYDAVQPLIEPVVASIAFE